MSQEPTPPASAPVAWGLLNANGDAWDFTANPDVAETWRHAYPTQQVRPLVFGDNPAPIETPVAWMWDTQLTPYKPSDYVNPRPLYAHPAPRGRVVVTEALQIAADLLTHAATSEDGIDAADAAEGVRVCRAALALVDAPDSHQSVPSDHTTPAPRGRVVVTEAMEKAAVDAWWNSAGDANDAIRAALTAALALVDADAPEVDREG